MLLITLFLCQIEQFLSVDLERGIPPASSVDHVIKELRLNFKEEMLNLREEVGDSLYVSTFSGLVITFRHFELQLYWCNHEMLKCCNVTNIFA